jgi:hypothetical protein
MRTLRKCKYGERLSNGKCPTKKRQCKYGERLSNGKCPKKQKNVNKIPSNNIPSRTEYMQGNNSVAEIQFFDNFFADEAGKYFKELSVEDWDFMYEKGSYGNPIIRNSRLMKWYSDNPTYTYAFSGNTLGGFTIKTSQFNEGGLRANKLTKPLIELRKKIISLLKQQGVQNPEFNSVLVNYYHDNKDSVTWHSDDDKWLGTRFMVPSISFGSERLFQLKVQGTDTSSVKKKKDALLEGKMNEWTLQNGSLLFMKGMTQEGFQHSVPEMTIKLGPRINVTFRHVHPELVKKQPKTTPFNEFKEKMLTKYKSVLNKEISGLAKMVLEKSKNTHDIYILLLILHNNKNNDEFDIRTEVLKRPQNDISVIHLKKLLSEL